MICWGKLKNHYLGSFVSVRYKNQVCRLWSLKRYNVRNWSLFKLELRSCFKKFNVCFILLRICKVCPVLSKCKQFYGSCCCNASLSFCFFWVVSCCSWLFSRPTWKLLASLKNKLVEPTWRWTRNFSNFHFLESCWMFPLKAIRY